MIDVSVLIVSYNTRDLTLNTLRSLKGPNIEVIVVDNASTDGSADAVSSSFPSVNVVRCNENLGYGRGVNLAATHAGGRYLLLLNPDIRSDGPFIDELLDYADKHPECGVYGGRTVREDGTDYLAGFAFPSIWGYLFFATGISVLHNPEELPHLDRSKPVAVPALSGCVLMIRRELFTSLGGFDRQFFVYGEDVDLCWRATLAGAQPTLVPAARVAHLGGASSVG